MDAKTIRAAITQAKVNENNWTILFIEIFLIAFGVGMGNKSWWVFGGVLLGLLVLMYIPVLGSLFLLALSAMWGVIGWGIGGLFNSTGAQVVLAVLGLLIGMGIHFSAREHLEDY